MVLSGSIDFTLTRDQIIEGALRKVRGIGHADTPAATQYTASSQALNAMVKSWQAYGINLWTVVLTALNLSADTRAYTLTADVLDITGAYFKHDGTETSLRLLTRQEYFDYSVKTTSGRPTGIFLDRKLTPVLYTYPVNENATSLVYGSNGNQYRCILDHTSAASNKPITGANYATYWEATGVTGGSDNWVTGTAYKSDVIWYNAITRLEDFDASANTPDFDVKWLDALIYGLAYRLAPEYGLSVTERQMLGQEAEMFRQIAKADDTEGMGLTISPNFRK